MGHAMSRVLCFIALPDAKRASAASMTFLSGNPKEFNIPLLAIPGGPSAEWDALQGYGGNWWGAFQFLAPEVAQAMLTSGYELEAESWFAAFWEVGGGIINHNLPSPPAEPTFASFIAAAGLQLLPGNGPFG